MPPQLFPCRSKFGCMGSIPFPNCENAHVRIPNCENIFGRRAAYTVAFSLLYLLGQEGTPMDAKHILVADNDPIAREAVAEFLDEQGYHVTPAADGQEALANSSAEAEEQRIMGVVGARS